MLQQREPCKVLVHHTCRCKFVDTRKVEKYEMQRKMFRSSIENTFEWKTDCFLCTKKALEKYLKGVSGKKSLLNMLKSSLK